LGLRFCRGSESIGAATAGIGWSGAAGSTGRRREAGSGCGERWFLWLDDPFANFESGEPEGALFAEIRGAKNKLHWYSIPSLDTWFAVEQPRPDGERVRPHVGLECRVLSLARIQTEQANPDPAQAQEWLVWYGETAGEGVRPRWVRNEYFLWSPHGDNGGVPVIFA